jgi:hypothetical protein
MAASKAKANKTSYAKSKSSTKSKPSTKPKSSTKSKKAAPKTDNETQVRMVAWGRG